MPKSRRSFETHPAAARASGSPGFARNDHPADHAGEERGREDTDFRGVQQGRRRGERETGDEYRHGESYPSEAADGDERPPTGPGRKSRETEARRDPCEQRDADRL